MSIISFLKKFILFVGFSLIFYVIAVVLYGEFFPAYFQKNIYYERFAYGFSNTRFKEVKTIKDVDILFLGSSRAYRHYDPRNFEKNGFKSFNLGSSSQTMVQTEILFNRYLNSLNPKYIVFDIYPGMFSSDGIESSFDLISNDYNSWDTLKMSLKLKNIMVLNTWIYAYYKEIFFSALDDNEKVTNGINRYIKGGYVERAISTNTVSPKNNQNWAFNKVQWQSFKSIIEKANNLGFNLIVVHSPRHSGFEYKYPDKIKNFLNSQNIHYFNYKKLEFINDSIHFYDPSHMNQNGVNAYNKFLMEKHFHL